MQVAVREFKQTLDAVGSGRGGVDDICTGLRDVAALLTGVETRATFLKTHYPSFVDFLLRKVAVEWLGCLSAVLRRELFDVFFDKAPARHAYMAVTAGFAWAKHTFLLETLSRTYARMTTAGRLAELLADLATVPRAAHAQTIRALVSLPDLAANGYQGWPPEPLQPKPHFAEIAKAVARATTPVAAAAAATAPESTFAAVASSAVGKLCSSVVGKVAMLGHAGSVMDVLAPYATTGCIPSTTSSSSPTTTIVANSTAAAGPPSPPPPFATAVSIAVAADQVAAVLADAGVGLEALLDAYLMRCTTRAAQIALIRAWKGIVHTNSNAKFLLTHKFVLIRTYTQPNDAHVLETIMALLAAASHGNPLPLAQPPRSAADKDGSGDGGGGGGRGDCGDGDCGSTGFNKLLLKTVLAVVEVWGDAAAIRSCPFEQHVYLSKAIVHGLAMMPAPMLVLQGQRVLQAVVMALQQHLDNTIAENRHLGYTVGELVTKLVDPEHPLLFNADKESVAAKALIRIGVRQTWHLEKLNPLPSVALLSSNQSAALVGGSGGEQGTRGKGRHAPTTSVPPAAKVGFNVGGKQPFPPASIGFAAVDGDSGGGSGGGPAIIAQYDDLGGLDDDPDDPDAPDADFFSTSNASDAGAHATPSPTLHSSYSGGGDAGARAVGGAGAALDSDDGSDSDDDDDDGGFAPYQMADDTADPNASKAPAYIRDAVKGLSAKDDPHKVETSFRALEALVRARPADLEEMAVGIVSAVLHMGNDYALDEFAVVRNGVLVAVTAACPALVGVYLSQQFYERNFTLGQRLDILDTIVGAVKELSAITPPTASDLAKQAVLGGVNAPPTAAPAASAASSSFTASPSSPTSSSGGGVPPDLPAVDGDDDTARREAARQLVQRRIESKTRRWGSTRFNRAPPPRTAENKFAEFAGSFFWPLLQKYDRGTPTMDLVGRDAILLGRLLYTLAAVLHSAGAAHVVPPMATTLMEVALSLRSHSDVLVRRGIAFSMVVILGAVQAELLASTMPGELREAQLWLEHLYEHDPDAECRGLAIAGLVALANIGKMLRGEV